MNPQRVEAIIAGNSEAIGAWYAWSTTTHCKTLLIDYRFCPPDTDMLGRWVEITIDSRYRAQKPVKILPDVFETRVMSGVTEVRVKFQHRGRCEDTIEMFHNDYFGLICDPRNIFKEVKNGAWYEGWIIKHREGNLNSRWRLSIHQDNLEPLSDMPVASELRPMEVPTSELCVVTALVRSYGRRSGSYFAWSQLRPRSTIVIEYPFCSQNLDLLGRWVKVSIDGKNRVQRPIILLDDVLKTRIRRKAVEVFDKFQQISNSVQQSNNQNEIFHSEYFGTIRDDMYVIENVKKHGWYKGWIEYDQPNEFAPRWQVAGNQIVDECECREDERERMDYRNDEKRGEDRLQSSNSGQNFHYYNQPYEPHDRKRSRSTERRNRLEFRHPSPELLNNERRRRSFSPERYQDARNQPIKKITTDKTYGQYHPADSQKDFRELIDPNIAHPPTEPITRQKRYQKTKEQEELLQLEMKLERASEIVAFFNSNKAINKAMRLMDIEHYNELLELTDMENL